MNISSRYFLPHKIYHLALQNGSKWLATNSQLTSLPMCGFIAQLVEHRTGIAEVTGSNPVEALIFFQGSLFQLLKLEIHCEDHISPSYISAVHI